MRVGKAVIYKALHKGDVNYRLTGVKHITVSLVAFSRFACVYSCKEISLLRISRFALLKKANGETLRPANKYFFERSKPKNAVILPYYK